MSEPGDTMRGPRPIADADSDAPRAPSGETPSGLIVRAAAKAVRMALDQRSEDSSRFAAAHPAITRGAKVLGKGLGYLVVAALAAAGVVVADQPDTTVLAVEQDQPEPDCDPAVLRYILHMADHGEALAVELEAAGEFARAQLIRNMTDVNKLPNDLQLCVLLANRTGSTP